MKKITILFALFVGLTSFHSAENNKIEEPIAAVAVPTLPKEVLPAQTGELFLRSLFAQFPENSVSWEAFKSAMTGRQVLMQETVFSKPDIITIVDFSKPSTQERLFVIDINEVKILFSSLTSHGRNTGENMATNFSNMPESYQSSLGFYKTAETYIGSKGFSMRLDGLETNINSNARSRGIVVHAADYVSKSFAQQHGRLGRSQGCPALPQEMNKPVIQKISGGSIFFIYAPNEQYHRTSKVIKASDINSFEVEAPPAIVKG